LIIFQILNSYLNFPLISLTSSIMTCKSCICVN